jgi:hypothetical protein
MALGLESDEGPLSSIPRNMLADHVPKGGVTQSPGFADRSSKRFAHALKTIIHFRVCFSAAQSLDNASPSVLAVAEYSHP